jgi:uncharacterized OB-fold protein
MAYDKPLPVPDPVTRPYWDGLKAHELRVQCCEDCFKAVFYPRVVCPYCGSRQLAWMTCSGKGTLHAFTIAHRGMPAAFKSGAPYVVAMVELEEGARMMTNLVGVEPSLEAVRIGMPVEIVFDDVTDAVTLAKFRPR